MKTLPVSGLLFLVLLGCNLSPSGDGTDPGGGGDPQVLIPYIAGYYNSGSADTAAYWVDDGTTVTRTDLPADAVDHNAYATGIYVDDSGIVYVSGFYNNGSNYVAVYWKDGVRSSDLKVNGRATGIAVDSSGTVYVSGYYGSSPQKAVYWTDDGTTVNEVLLSESNSAVATGIAVSGAGTVYVSGEYTNSSSTLVPAYWVDNGTVTPYPLTTTAGSNAKGIWSDGTDTYVAGRYYSGTAQAAAYWENGVSAAKELNVTGGQAYTVTAGSGGVYAAGTYFNSTYGALQAAWWLNDSTNQTDLDGDVASDATYAYGIAVDGTDVYVAGTQAPGGIEEAVFWKNGVMTALESGVLSSANAVFLAP